MLIFLFYSFTHRIFIICHVPVMDCSKHLRFISDKNKAYSVEHTLEERRLDRVLDSKQVYPMVISIMKEYREGKDSVVVGDLFLVG